MMVDFPEPDGAEKIINFPFIVLSLKCHSERSEESVKVSLCIQILRIAQDDMVRVFTLRSKLVP